MKYINNGFLKIKIILSKRINFSISKYFYLSYYHLLLNSYEEKINPNNYITTFPNRSAGFGHQLTDVISAFSISKEFEFLLLHQIQFSRMEFIFTIK